MANQQESQSPVLCALADVEERVGKEIMLPTAAGMRYLMLFRVDGDVRAYLNTCPHQGRSLSWAPGKFLFGNGGTLVCPHHGACFDLTDGSCISGPCQGAGLTPVKTVVENGQVLLAEPFTA